MKRLILIAVLLQVLVSCEKELDFDYHDIEQKLVIEAVVTGEGADVTLTRTTPMNETIDRTPVSDATVTLTDVTAGRSKRLAVNARGIFHDDEPGIEGHEYKITVNRGDKSYESSCLMRREVPIVGLEFQWIKMPYDYVAILQTTFEDADTPADHYWLRLLRNGEPYMWLLSDDRFATDGKISEVVMTSRQDLDEEDEMTALRDGDVVEVLVTAIPAEMYDYLMALQTDSNGPRMFTGDFCLGYFLAAPVSRASIVFRPDEMKIFK